MSLRADTITNISAKSCSDYLPRIRTIAACLADSIGMDPREVKDTTKALTAACLSAMEDAPRGSGERGVFITVKTSRSEMAMDIAGCSSDTDGREAGLGFRLVRRLAYSIEFIRRQAGLRIWLIKQARNRRRLRRRLREMAECAHRG